MQKKIASLGGPLAESDTDLTKRRKGINIILLIALESLATIQLRNEAAREQAFSHLLKAAAILERAI